MEVTLEGLGRLTTEHAASSSGQGVLLVAPYQEAFEPGDQVDVGGAWERAAIHVQGWLGEHAGELDSAEREFVEAFAHGA